MSVVSREQTTGKAQVAAEKRRSVPDQRLLLADRLAWAAALLTLAASAASVLTGSRVYEGTAELIEMAFANDVFMLVVTTPLLLIALWSARRGSLLGRLAALGGLACAAYQYAVFALGLRLNALTLVHVAIVGLALWAILLTLQGLDAAHCEAVLGGRIWRRATAAFFFFMVVITCLHWVSAVAGVLTTGSLPADLAAYGWVNNPLITIELVFLLPVLVVVGLQLLRREGGGTHRAVPLLILFALLDLGLFLIPVVAVLRGQPFEAGTALFGAAFFALPAALLLRVFVPRGRTAQAA